MRRSTSRLTMWFSLASLVPTAPLSAAPDSGAQPPANDVVDLLAPLTREDQGRVFSETPGGTVAAKAAGKPTRIRAT